MIKLFPLSRNKVKAISMLALTFLLNSCDNFQGKLFSKIDNVKSNQSDTFDLQIITDFEWDSALYYEGNESVGEHKELIEEILNNKISEIDWEERRFNGKVDSTLIYKSEDLKDKRDRFYFLTADKKIITKEIDHYGQNQGRYFEVYNTEKDTTIKSTWIARENCKIITRDLIRN
jgi:hypothetical protein